MGNTLEQPHRSLFAAQLSRPSTVFKMRLDTTNRVLSRRFAPTGAYFSNHDGNNHTLNLGSVQNLKNSYKMRAKDFDLSPNSLKLRKPNQKFKFSGWEDEVKFDPQGREKITIRQRWEEPRQKEQELIKDVEDEFRYLDYLEE